MTELLRAELAPGYDVSRIINGCWQLSPDHGGGPDGEAAVFRQFAERVEQGFTTFDCADIYTGVEETIGRFRRTLAQPDRLQVHTKFVPDNATLHELDDRRIDAAIDRSLTRLGVERLDLVQLHWWRYEVPGLHATLARLRRACEQGKIRLIGATNFNTAMLREMRQVLPELVSMQTQFSLLDRRPLQGMTEFSEKAGVRLLAYGALGGGFLSSDWLGAPEPAAMNRSLTKYRLIIEEIGGWDAYQRLLQCLDRIARQHDVSVGAVAARWVLDQPGVAAIILGVGRRSRVAENRRIASLELDEDDHRQLQRCLARQRIPPGDPYDLERDPDGPHSAIIKTNLNAGENQ